MKLDQLPVILIDGQTTGMRPSSGQLLEMAWTVTTAASPDIAIESFLLALPEGEKIPYRIAELTGITDADLASSGNQFCDVLAALQTAANQLAQPPLSVIHYAQFEKPFLLDLFSRGGLETLPFEILCSHSLTKKLLPNLPSQNIRGTAGYFGNPVGHLKRSSEHVRATADIWRGLVKELQTKGITEWPELKDWLSLKVKTTKGRYEYRLPSEKRLALPDAPGIYRMIAKSGDVLYVGKATSLKSRVNSYFRGKAGRDKRKLELMAQVWDLNVTECKTALEAALMEADEIKKFNPPYNVVMKKGRRHLLFYAEDFSSVSRTQSKSHPVGPFRNTNWMEHLRLLSSALTTGIFEAVFFQPLPADQMARAFAMYCEAKGIDPTRQYSVRELLAVGLNDYRNYEEPLPEEIEEVEDPSTDYTDEEVAGKFERLLRRAGQEYSRSKLMTKMLNTRVTYQHKGESRVLDFKNGFRCEGAEPAGEKKLWHDLGVETYDRISVLLSELQKYDHHIEWCP